MESVKIHSNNNYISKNLAFIAVAFILWPFMGFLLAMKDFQNKFSKTIILLFLMLFGLLFCINPLQDSKRRADMLKESYTQPFEAIYDTFDKLYEETLDFVEPVIIYSVSRFTDYHGVLFAVYAFIFGSLMLYYLTIMHQHYLKFSNRNALLFLILLIFVNPIYEINGFRMWTAAWVFSVGMLNYLHKPHWKHLMFAALSITVHFSFMPLVGLIIIYAIAGNRTFIYGVIAIATFFVAELDIHQVRSYAALLGTASETKITAYTGESYIEERKIAGEQAAGFLKLNQKGMLYFSAILLLLVYFKNRGVFKQKLTDSFYSLTLLLLSFANISSLLPSGARFYRIYYIFAFSTFILFFVYEKHKQKMVPINLLALPLVMIFVLVSFRLFSDPASIYLFGPIFFIPTAFFENVSLQSILF